MSGFQVWPTANPGVMVPLGEVFRMSLRIKPLNEGRGPLQLADGTPGQFRLRREPNREVYWLDVELGPMKEAGGLSREVVLKTGGEGSPDLTLRASVEVPPENVIVSSKSVSLSLPVSALKAGRQSPAKISINKLIGPLQLKSVSSSLPFLKIEAQTIVQGRNYLLRVGVDSSKLPDPGTYNGVLRVETDDALKPKIEIAVTVVLLNQ